MAEQDLQQSEAQLHANELKFVEVCKTAPEQTLFLLIAGVIDVLETDESSHPIFEFLHPTGVELVQRKLDYAKSETSRFGVNSKEKKELEAWYAWWAKYFFEELKEEQRGQFITSSTWDWCKVAQFRPEGSWKDLMLVQNS